MREKLYLHAEEIPDLLRVLTQTLSECLILSTCNRTEIYCVSDSPDIDVGRYKRLLVEFKNTQVDDEHFFTLLSCAACRQLFSVATSIDSMVVGDSQILRQLREAYTISKDTRSAGKVLNQLLQRAFKVGKRSYTESTIHDGAVSVSLAAVELATDIFGQLHDKTVLILGAGETARLTAEALINKRVGKILVANRTQTNAQRLLEALPQEGLPQTEIVEFESFRERLCDADIVISSTGSDEPVIRKADLASLDRKMLFIDIAVPRDIDADVAELPNVVLRNIDDLHSIADENYERRRVRDIPKVKSLVMREMVDYLTWYYSLPLMPDSTAVSAGDFKKLKTFLADNISEIHKLAARSDGDFDADLQNHFSLVDRLQQRHAAFSGSAS